MRSVADLCSFDCEAGRQLVDGFAARKRRRGRRPGLGQGGSGPECLLANAKYDFFEIRTTHAGRSLWTTNRVLLVRTTLSFIERGFPSQVAELTFVGGLLRPGRSSGGLTFLQWQDMSRCRRIDAPLRKIIWKLSKCSDVGERQRAEYTMSS